MSTLRSSSPIPARSWYIALGTTALLLAAAFIMARTTVDRNFFSFSPPSTPDNSAPPADVLDQAGALRLYQTFYTAWATMILLFPALIWFLFRKQSETAARRWLLFWTVSYVAFLVHLYWALFICRRRVS